MSGGMNWIRAKDCNGLVEMEKGRQKRELIDEFLEDLNWYSTDGIWQMSDKNYKKWVAKKNGEI